VWQRFMTSVVLRTAAYADAGAIAALHVASWRDAFRGMIPDSVLDGPMLDERLPMWRQVLAIMPAGRMTLVAVDEAATAEAPIVGFASGGRRRGRERDEERGGDRCETPDASPPTGMRCHCIPR